jgi:glucose/arabinose dehydrogenase
VFSDLSFVIPSIPKTILLAILLSTFMTIICISNFEVNAEQLINDPSISMQTSIEGIKNTTKMKFLVQNDSHFSETFDGPVKIVNETLPTLSDPALKTETVFMGIKFPTSMAFLGPDDILVLEKNQGTVRKIVNGNMLDRPLLDVNVANSKERGMLGIAISKQESKIGGKPTVYVFLYYTETKSKDGEDLEGGGPLGNRLYRYELVNNKLINPKLLLDLPVEPVGTGFGFGEHQGGVVLVGPDNNVYLVIGEVNQYTQAQNILDGREPNGTGGILRITQDGKPVGNGILGDTYPLNLYYAYGIRNSFGMDFDPVTGKLWDTDNGLNCCDEINLVEPGFNSGWAKVQGIVELNQSNRLQQLGIFNETLEKEKLVTFDGRGKYSSPEFIWFYPVAPSAIKFLNSDKLGEQYKNDIFIGNVNHESLYHFDLTENRRELLVSGKIINKTVGSREDPKDIIFATGIGRVTDIDVGPDGNLYILAHNLNIDNPNLQRGSIFKISKLVEKGNNAIRGQVRWANNDNNILSISMETNEPIAGNGSLRVDINPAGTVNEIINSSWSVVSSDFIPVNENTYYNYTLDLSAKKVNQLHSKVIYYDSNKKERGSDFIFGGTDGTFKKQFSNSLLSPVKTKYVQLQTWVKPSVGINASYLVDNVKLETS